MDVNPYESPNSPNPEHARAGGSTSRSIFSVLSGGILVEYVGSHLALIPVMIYLVFALGTVDAARQWFQGDTASLVSKGIGILFAFLGGLTAAYFSRRKPVLHAIAATSVATVIGLPSWLQRELHTKPLSWLTMVFCFAVSLYGGKLIASRSQTKRT